MALAALPAVLAALSVLMLSSAIGGRLICRQCYRLGNFIDFSVQGMLLRALSSSSGPGVTSAMRRADALARGIYRGVSARRMFQMRWFSPPSLIERLHNQPYPAAEWAWLAERPEAAALRSTLIDSWASARHSQRYAMLWWNVSHTQMLLPSLQPTLRALVDSAPGAARGSTTPAPTEEAGRGGEADLCVVHFRTGDYTRQGPGGSAHWKTPELRLAVASMIAAAHTFPQTPRRFEILSGGIDHGCDPAADDCGATALRMIARGLRLAFRTAAVELRRAGADEDFLRMARAGMLLVGGYGGANYVGSSFAVYGAVASRGHVRTPACFLRHAPCMASRMTPTWHGYAHPLCAHCRKPSGQCSSASASRPAPHGCGEEEEGLWEARVAAARESLEEG